MNDLISFNYNETINRAIIKCLMNYTQKIKKNM